MKKGKNLWILAVGLIFLLSVAQAQKIDYSLVDKDDFKEMSFEIIGKLNGNILVYKNFRSHHAITIYDNEMQQKNRIDLTFLPDKVINVDFIAYNDFAYMFYQYQKKNTVYSSVIKLNGEGKMMTDPVDLDTTQVGNSTENKVYTIVNSDDKKKIILFKIKRDSERNYYFTTILYDQQLQKIKKTNFAIESSDKDVVFTDFVVDNDGDFAFGKCTRIGSRDYINKVDLVYKKAASDSVFIQRMPLNETTLDELKIKSDNFNRKIILSSFYYKQRRGNIEGIYSLVWDKSSQRILHAKQFPFSDSLRMEAKSDNNSIKSAFNDQFIRQVVPTQDGGFAVFTESYYSSSRNNAWNRYDYLYGPGLYMSPFYSPYYYSPMNRFYPYGWYDPFNRYGMQNNLTRYVSENIVTFFFDNDGNLKWSNTIRKSQYDDNTDSYLGYQLFNTGNEIRFLFNQKEKRELLLNSASIEADGKLKRQPTLKNLNKDYDFMPKFGKQVSLRQIIMPCMYKNYICFAKIEY
ncbi:MAG: hypothetical protein RLY11_1622 [Bacteroidota bacterium]|jgi:hypothetical protein